MEIELKWIQEEGCSQTLVVPTFGGGLIQSPAPRFFINFIMDSGGMSYDIYIPDFIKLRDKIRQSRYDDSVDKSFCTESWCAVVKGDVTTTSFAFDDTYSEDMDTEMFYKVLCEWIEFVMKGPSSGDKLEVRRFTI